MNNPNQLCECGHPKRTHHPFGCVNFDEKNGPCSCITFRPQLSLAEKMGVDRIGDNKHGYGK